MVDINAYQKIVDIKAQSKSKCVSKYFKISQKKNSKKCSKNLSKYL